MRCATTLVLLSLTGLSLLSCEAITGKEVARLTVDTISTEGHTVSREARLDLKKGENIALWSHMDVAYDGDPKLYFQLQLLRDTVVEKEVLVDPFDKRITIGEKRTEFNGHVDHSFTGKNGELPIAEDGTYIFRTRLVRLNDVPVELRKAELILKK
jgi:hypothetical protein